MINLVAKRFNELFELKQNKQDEAVKNDISRAFGILLQHTAPRSEETCGKVIQQIHTKVKHNLVYEF